MRKEEFGLILNLAQVSTHVLNFLVDARNSAMPSEEGSSKHPVVPGAHSLVGKKETSINRSRRKKKKLWSKITTQAQFVLAGGGGGDCG